MRVRTQAWHSIFTLPLVLFLEIAGGGGLCFAEDPKPASAPAVLQGAPVEAGTGKAPGIDLSGRTDQRSFYQVLEDTLADYEYDLQAGNVHGIKDVALRNIAVSENIPPSFKTHLELLITEKTIRHGKARVIQCMACRAKRATLNGDNVIITSPDNNPTEQLRIARQQNIIHFMDLAFSYQPTGILISITNTEAESGAVIWSRSYNSETSRAAAFRRGVDYSQVEEARTQTEYKSTLQYRPIFYYLFEPDVTQSVGMMVAGFRLMERYDNRKMEVGFELNYNVPAALLGLGSATDATGAEVSTMWSAVNFTMLFAHGFNFIGDFENFNKARFSATLLAGGTFVSGYFGALFRVQGEIRMARHWVGTVSIGYRPESTLFVSGIASAAVSGIEWGVGLGAVF